MVCNSSSSSSTSGSSAGSNAQQRWLLTGLRAFAGASRNRTSSDPSPPSPDREQPPRPKAPGTSSGWTPPVRARLSLFRARRAPSWLSGGPHLAPHRPETSRSFSKGGGGRYAGMWCIEVVLRCCRHNVNKGFNPCCRQYALSSVGGLGPGVSTPWVCVVLQMSICLSLAEWEGAGKLKEIHHLRL